MAVGQVDLQEEVMEGLVAVILHTVHHMDMVVVMEDFMDMVILMISLGGWRTTIQVMDLDLDLVMLICMVVEVMVLMVEAMVLMVEAMVLMEEAMVVVLVMVVVAVAIVAEDITLTAGRNSR